jgi:calcium-dependent protein kinase
MGCAASAKPAPTNPTEEIRKVVVAGGINKAQFITENTGRISDVYTLQNKKLGKGSYGSVMKGTHRSTGLTRAVKVISKSQMKNLTRFQQEIAIMKMMDHPNIVKLYETFQDAKNIYLVMELCGGGELFDRIIEAGQFTEVICATIMHQIVKAIYYMHENSVCHRDLKPENFLFMTKESIAKNHLKIIDFGLSCQFAPGQVLTTKAGTPYYVAPQVLAGKYDHLSDMWSIGVIMYVMLCGYPPFFGETDAEVLSKVRLGEYKFDAAEWKNISDDAKGLIRKLLKMNPKDRYTAEEALNHDWIKNKAPKAKDVSLSAALVDNLRGFRSQNKLKKAALHIIANQLSEDQIKTLREMFSKLDENGDGHVTAQELTAGMASAGLKEIPPDLLQIMKDIDADGSGKIDYTEFLAATLDQKMYLQDSVCWAAFGKFDKDGSGDISLDELKLVLGDEDVQDVMAIKNAEEIMKQIDEDGNGTINFDEFMRMMRGSDS